MGEIVTTSFRVDEDLWTDFKLEAVRRKMNYADLLGIVLIEFLKK